jgi:ABC-2 type transport system permease protein
MKRFFAIFAARNLEFFRDKSTFMWNLILPIFLIFGFAFGFSGDGGTNYKVATLGGAKAAPAFMGYRYLKLIPYASLDEALGKLRHHQLDMVLDLGAGDYYVNESSPGGYVVEKMLQSDRDQSFSKKLVSGKPIRYIDWFVPGVIGMNILLGSLIGVGFVIVRYRRNGVLKRFKATPIGALEFVGAQMLSRFFIVAFISALVFAGTDLFLHFRMEGSWLALALVTALSILCMISLGLAFASRMKSEELAGGLMNLVTWPMMLLSGIFFSLEGTPPFLRSVAKFFPMTRFVDSARAIMLDGAGLAAVSGDLAALGLMTVLFLGIAAALFKWE